MHYDHTVHFSADLSLWLHSSMFLAPWHLLPAVFFQFHMEEGWGMDKCKLGVISQERLKIEVKLLLSANRKSYAASIGTRTDDLE